MRGRKLEGKEGGRGERVDKMHDAVWDNGDLCSVVVRVRKKEKEGGSCESVDKEERRISFQG